MTRPLRPAAEPSHEATRPDPPPRASDRLALRLDEVAHSLGVSRRSIERERPLAGFRKLT